MSRVYNHTTHKVLAPAEMEDQATIIAKAIYQQRDASTYFPSDDCI